MSGIDVLTLGETMGTIRAEGTLGVGPEPRISIAGAESNVAIGLARLGHRSAWASVLGSDAIGDLIVRTLAAERVDTTAVRREQGAPSGILVSQQRPMGRARVDYHRAHSAFTAIGAADARAALDPGPTVVHLSGITPALGPGPAEATLALTGAARTAGMKVSLDVNFRSRLWSPEQARPVLAELATYADVVFGDPGELALLTSGAQMDLEALFGLGVGEVVIKLGGDGARVRTVGDDVLRPALRVDVVDPIGAGDAFVAGYLSALLEDLPLPQRLERGNACGAAVVSSRGDWEAMLTRTDLDSLDTAPGAVQR
ncbi:sugar kinase [Pseudactinotalea sp. Z1748]|uniref:sugar kinase n=1 Tax=Pseudactinotalea sp. Z1748 TaxID=3413027 RepID=UPI003C7B6CF5